MTNIIPSDFYQVTDWANEDLLPLKNKKNVCLF